MESPLDPEELWREASRVFVGGAQGRLRREFHGIEPLVVVKAQGSRVWDAYGRELLDFHLAFGAIALGHNDRDVAAAVVKQLDRMVLHGAGVSDVEVEYAKLLLSRLPGYSRVLFTNSGSEAVMIALRLARAYTSRDVIVKFDGNYHGWHDYSMFNVKTPATVGKRPETLGIPRGTSSTVEVLPYNDAYNLEKFMSRMGGEVAAIILEPVAHSMGVVPADRDFVAAAREACDEHGCLLIFDEILTFVRDSLIGMRNYFGVDAEITLVGKSIANGLPVAAVLGIEEVMSLLEDKVVSSGTFSGHPLSMAGGMAALSKAVKLELDKVLWEKASKAASMVASALEDSGVDAIVAHFGGAFSIYFGLSERPKSLSEALRADGSFYRRFAAKLRRKGILVSPNPLKRFHLSYSHSGEDLELLSTAVEEAAKEAKAEG